MTVIDALETAVLPDLADRTGICLCVGSGQASANLFATLGKKCPSIRLYHAPGEGRREQGAYPITTTRLPGPIAAAAEYPPVADVVAFARIRPDSQGIVARFAEARRAANVASDVEPALAAVTASMPADKIDLVVIDGEPILAGVIARQLTGARYILLFDNDQTFGGAAAFSLLYGSTDYRLAARDDGPDQGWTLFERTASDLPIHFFTIVLNGEPFLRYHLDMLAMLPFRWHWHVVEGVASLVKDTAWSVAAGGHIPPGLHCEGLSIDGTSDYLDAIAASHPNKVSIYRKGDGRFWDGKLEMVNAPLAVIGEECLLWQIDADELWAGPQVVAVRAAFLAQPARTAAAFWCNYYAGPDRGISTRWNYAQDPRQEWLRVWRFRPGMKWDKHEPPILEGRDATGDYDVGSRNCFSHRETETMGAVFDHFAYATEEQLQFKESYYGYAGAVAQWQALQTSPPTSVHLRDYFSWVADETMVDTVARLGWTPLAWRDATSGEWRFDGSRARFARVDPATPLVVVDGVFFQLGNSGIARVWINLLKEWARSGFGEHVVLLDRGGTAPRIDGVRYCSIERHDWSTIDGDARYLQEVCDRLDASLFLSTYYTTPTRTPTIFFGYDMIPELLGVDLDDVWWRQKRRAIQFAQAHVMISQNSARDLARLFPQIDVENVLVAHCSVDQVFTPCDPRDIDAFRKRHDLDREYVVLVGDRIGWKGYKNGVAVFAALSCIPPHRRPLLVCVGGAPDLEDLLGSLLREEDVRLLRLDDADLRCCYAGSLAYICPSRLEGFGLPIVEAMAVGTPVLVCRNSSIPEVAGDAGIYFDADDPGSLIDAIETARDQDARAGIVEIGRRQAATFDQTTTAEAIARFCIAVEERRPVPTSALADALIDAQASHQAHRQLARAHERLFAGTTALAAACRTLERVREQPSDGPSLDDLDLIEGAVAHALASLRGDEDAIAATDPSGMTLPPDGATITAITGLSRAEGPYPAFHMFREFRWQTSAESLTSFALPSAADVWIECEFGNVETDQQVTLALDGRPICSFRPLATGWQHQWRLRVPASLSRGAAAVAVRATRAATSPEDGRHLFIAMYGVRLTRRTPGPRDGPEIVDLANHDRREAVAPVLEVPTNDVAANGLAPREGPYPDLDILDGFRWQIAETSEHRCEIVEDREAWLDLCFSNVEPEQDVTIYHDDVLLRHFVPPNRGWAHRWRIVVPVTLRSGTNSFRIQARSYHAEEGGRHLYLGLYYLRLALRLPEVIPGSVSVGKGITEHLVTDSNGPPGAR